MKCPNCGEIGQSQVIDTNTDLRGNTRRRRECKICRYRFNTLERPALGMPMLVKTSGERQEFDREKLIQGIRVACAKRAVSTADITRLVDSVETHLQSLGREEVSSRVVGDRVIEGLKELDPIAYIRYAIVYLGLDDLEAVRAETDKLLTEQNEHKLALAATLSQELAPALSEE